MTPTAYPTQEEKIVREAAQTGSYVTDEMIDELAAYLEKVRLGEKLLVALVPYSGYYTNGDVWVEIIDVWENHSGVKMVTVQTVTGNQLFQEYCGEGQYIPTDKHHLHASSLNHIALIEGGKMVRYYGRYFSKSRNLVPDVPIQEDFNSRMARLRELEDNVLSQQELVREGE